jgi:predicted branched-subunit amino acid permease
MATLVLPSDRYHPRSHLHQEDPEWQAGYQAGRHKRWLIAGASGGLLGYLIGRPHHLLVWASLMALVVISVVVALYIQRHGWWPPKPRPTTAWPGIGPR